MEEALRSLCEQTIDPSLFEIIVVDNNSTDHSKETVHKYADTHTNVRYYLETEQGLSHARNSGYQIARGKYVGYLDDDAKAPENWVRNAIQVIDEKSPTAFGGPYFPWYSCDKPAWFKDEYASNPVADHPGNLSGFQYLSGNNIFFHKDTLIQLGGFDPELGMKGNIQAYGEETALQWRIRDEIPNSSIYFTPDLWIHHLARPEKISLIWNLRHALRRGHDSARAARHGKQARHSNAQKLLLPFQKLGKMLYCPTLGILLRNRKRYPFVQNYAYEVLIPLVATTGKVLELIKNKIFRK